MISISQHLISAGKGNPDAYLDAQAAAYWQVLNPSKSGVYSATSLISKIREYRDLANTLDQKYLFDYAYDDQFVAMVQLEFFEELLSNSALLLKKIITGNPHELELIKNAFKIKFPSEIFFTLNGTSKVQTDFGRLLSEKIFSYSKFRSSKFCLQYLGNLSFNEVYCIYCGYEPVELVGKITSTEDTEKALLDLDHFFSKAEFPYLAISLFNLIPCCHICNSRYKLTKEFGFNTHIHPYTESFDEHFSFSIELTRDGRQVCISPIGGSMKTSSLKDLGLEERYEKKKKLLKLETDYKLIKKYRGKNSKETFVKYMLKDVPLTQSEIISECLGKAKRDILRSIDAGGILRPHIK